MRNKKADNLLPELIVGIIITLSVSIMIIAIVTRFVHSSRFEATFLSRDVALLVDSLYAAPNDISIRYPQKTEQFTFIFNDKGRVSIQKDGQILATEYFTTSKNIKFINKTLEPIIEIEDEEDKTLIVLNPENPQGYVPLKFTKKGDVIEPSQAINIFEDG
jgi:hypothetical protein